MTHDFKGGCSIHIEYQAKDFEDLQKACELLSKYQYNLHATINGGNGDDPQTKTSFPNHGLLKSNGRVSKEKLDRLFEIAKAKNVYLVKEVQDRFHKKPTELTGEEADWLLNQIEGLPLSI